MSERAGTVVTERPEQAVPPPVDPDPKLIDHLEGNAWSRCGLRKEADTHPEPYQ